MPSTSHGLKLTIYAKDDDVWNHQPLYHEIIRRARKAGLSTATVHRGIEGYGTDGIIHTSRLLSLSHSLPLTITIIDTEKHIRHFLPQLSELIHEGTATLQNIEIITYTPTPQHD
ncbi:hypothetical protein VT50_0237070 [Streptomyces antioxidans]|uniref:Uncharacterized protein n=1 Tax=Streptomyces antioxidans TaxID=1507734 RepID=A0A1V4CTH3_9ACTN|nr:DUF190 domain-containing protein [Streptomyces antioxidans]OPF69780.1 hypothetical protein VT50_0237070 [Streptomyces antioxidans]